MLYRTIVAFLAIVCGWALPVHAQTTALLFDSQPGDYIGQGQQRTWTPADLTFRVNSSSLADVTIRADNFSTASSGFTWWDVQLRAPEGAVLAAGTYERADWAAFRPAPLPGLDVSGSGRGCSTLSGRFVIHQITFSGTTLTSLAADFEQRCGSSSGALFGAIRYNSNRATLTPFDGNYPTYLLTVSSAANGYVTGGGIDCGAGRSDCTETFGVPTSVGLTPVPSAGYVFLGWAGDCSGATATLLVDRRRLCTPVFNSADGGGGQSPNYGNGAIFIDETGSSDTSRNRAVHLSSLAGIAVSGSASSIAVRLEGPSNNDGTFDFVPPVGSALTAGEYLYAGTITGSRGAFPGLQTNYCGSGGRFRIYELTFSGGAVASFAADLEQRCGGEANRTFVAAIRYRSARSSLLPFDGVYPLYKVGVQTSVGGRVAGPGIDCGAGSTDCDEAFSSATSLTLQALPSTGYEFLAWSGACAGSASAAQVVADRTRQCTAYFQPTLQSGASPDPAFGSRMLFRYQPGTSAGQRRVWTARDAAMSVSASFQSVYVSADGPHGSSYVQFAAPTGATLVPGYYDEAYPQPNPKFARLDTASCQSEHGRFRVYEFTTNSNGQVLTFAADFELQCMTGGPVYGAVRFNSTRATIHPFDGAFPAYTLSITPSSRGVVTGPGLACGGTSTDCSEAYSSASSVTLTATPLGGNIFLGWGGACAGASTTVVTVRWPTRCAAVFVAPNGTAATEDPSLSQGALLIDSEPGDPVGLGVKKIWSADSHVTVSQSSRNYLSLSVAQANGAGWRLDFRAPSGSDLAVGMYENTTIPWSSSTSPGLSISGPAGSCSSPKGRFQVHEIAFTVSTFGSLTLSRFAADFELRCANATGSLRGAIRFNSSRPNLLPFAPATASYHLGIALGLSAYTHGGWIATKSGAAASYSPMPWARVPWETYNATGKGVRVAAGDVDGDGLDELVVGLESGGNGWLAVLDDGAHGFALLKWIQVPWPEYNAANGAVWPAVGDLDGDGRAEIVVGLGTGGRGWFAIFDDAGSGFEFLTWRQVNWPIYNAADGSTRPVIANVDGTGPAEIVLGLGRGSNGWIEVFGGSAGSYAHQAWLQVPWASYNSANGETYVAAGDLDGDGSAEIVAGLGVGGAGYLYIFDDANTRYARGAWRRTSWTAYADDLARGQIYPAVGDTDGDGRAEIVLGFSPHPNGGWIEILDDNGAGNATIAWRNVGWAEFAAAGGGVFPAIGRFW